MMETADADPLTHGGVPTLRGQLVHQASEGLVGAGAAVPRLGQREYDIFSVLALQSTMPTTQRRHAR